MPASEKQRDTPLEAAPDLDGEEWAGAGRTSALRLRGGPVSAGARNLDAAESADEDAAGL